MSDRLCVQNISKRKSCSRSVWNRCLQTMVDNYKLLQSARKSYQAIGLDPFQLNPTPTKCNRRIFLIAFSMLQMLVSSAAFFIFKAETIQEFTASFYTSITELFLLMHFFSLITKMDDISKETVTFENLIEKSQWKYYIDKKIKNCFSIYFA